MAEDKEKEANSDSGFPDEEDSQHATNSRPVLLKNTFHEVVFVFLICSAQLFTQAAQSQVLAPINYITETLQTTTRAESTWYMASFSLTVGTFILIAGRLGDMYGHKTIFVIGYAWFGLWSLIAGFSAFSKSQIFFDVCRAMQGIGPSLTMPTGLAILGTIYPPGARKAAVFCIFGGCAPTGAVLGLTFASIFAQFVWWPWGFWVMGMFCALIALTSFFVIPDESLWQFNSPLKEKPIPSALEHNNQVDENDLTYAEDDGERSIADSEQDNENQRPSNPDEIGNEPALMSSSSTSFEQIVDDDEEPIEDIGLVPVDSRTYVRPTFDYLGAILGVSGLILFNFAWNQAAVVTWNVPYTYVLMIVGVVLLTLFTFVERHVQHPLLPPECFSIDLLFILLCIMCGWGSFGLFINYFILFLLDFRDKTPLGVSAEMVPVVLSGAAAALTTSFLFGKRVPAAFIMIISMCAFFAGQTLLAFMPVDQVYWIQAFLTAIITPWGMDMSFPAATLILSDHMPKKYQGIAASLVNTVVNYSISTGLGFAGTVEYRENRNGTDVLRGFRSAWYLGMGISGLGIASSVTYAVFGFVRSRKHAHRKSQG